MSREGEAPISRESAASAREPCVTIHASFAVLAETREQAEEIVARWFDQPEFVVGGWTIVEDGGMSA